MRPTHVKQWPDDHQHDYQTGISLSLSDLLKLDSGTRKKSVPRYARAPQEGVSRSVQKGRGMDYAESRIYQVGDEIRHIDWRVTARTGKWHTKVFQVERERPVLLLLDQSQPMFFSTRTALKSVLAARLAARALWRHQRISDRIGLLSMSDDKLTSKRPSAQRHDAIALLQLIVQQHQQQILRGHNLVSTENLLLRLLQECRDVATPGTRIYAFFNLFSLNSTHEALLARISRHNPVQIYALYDPVEMHLPSGGHYSVSDLQQTITLDTQDSGSATYYAHQFQQRLQHWRDQAQKNQWQLIPVCTQDGFSSGLLDE